MLVVELEQNPDQIPVVRVTGGEVDQAVAESALANLLYSPAVAAAKDREAMLLAEWPKQSDEAKRLLRREICICEDALRRYG